MPRKTLNSFKSQHDKEIEAFVESWDWPEVTFSWKRRLEDFSVDIANIFTYIHVYDSSNPCGRKPQLTWCNSHDIRELQLELQEHFDKHPGTVGPADPDCNSIRKGEYQTLEYLWEFEDSEEMLCAVLVSASLFPRMHSSRRHYPHDNWPPYYCVNVLDEWAKEKLYESKKFYDWHYSCTDVIPRHNMNHDYVYVIESLGGIIQYLAEEHAALLSSIKPVQIIFDNKKDPFVENLLDKKYKDEEKHHREWEERLARQKAEEEKKIKTLKDKHPRWGEWKHLSKEALEELVWTKPTKLIAEDFGVSDVAVGKRCKSEGINKPPRGFWAKVDSGKIPHPNGVPVDS